MRQHPQCFDLNSTLSSQTTCLGHFSEWLSGSNALIWTEELGVTLLGSWIILLMWVTSCGPCWHVLARSLAVASPRSEELTCKRTPLRHEFEKSSSSFFPAGHAL